MKTTFTFLFIIIMLIFNGSLSSQSTFEIYVSSRGTHSVKKYDMNGDYLGDFVESGAGGLSTTEDILFHPDGSVLVSGFGNNTIKQYDGVSGEYLGDFSTGYSLLSPSKMSIGPDSLIYITQWSSTQNKVARFTLEGDYYDEFTSVGISNGLGHVWDVDNNFYVAVYGNGGNGTVHMFDPDGNDLGTFINTTVLQGPTSIWWDTDSSMLVEDWTLGKVFRFDSSGEYVEEFLSGMTNPEGITVTPDGDLLIGDWGQDAIHLFSATGENMGYFSSGNGLTDPNSVKMKMVTATSVNEMSIKTKSISVYPTVTSGLVTIEFELEKENLIRIEVMDLLGRIAGDITERKYSIGHHSIIWQAGSTVENGHYFLRISDGSQLITERIIIEK